jgi:hypothetical protein
MNRMISETKLVMLATVNLSVASFNSFIAKATPYLAAILTLAQISVALATVYHLLRKRKHSNEKNSVPIHHVITPHTHGLQHLSAKESGIIPKQSALFSGADKLAEGAPEGSCSACEGEIDGGADSCTCGKREHKYRFPRA